MKCYKKTQLHKGDPFDLCHLSQMYWRNLVEQKKIYNEKEDAEQEKNTKCTVWREREHQEVQRAKSWAQRNKKFKEKPDAKWNKETQARLHLAKLPTCEKKSKNILSSERNPGQQKVEANEGAKFQPQQAE